MAHHEAMGIIVDIWPIITNILLFDKILIGYAVEPVYIYDVGYINI